MPRPQTGIPLLSISTGEGNLGINGCIKNKRYLECQLYSGQDHIDSFFTPVIVMSRIIFM